MAMPPEEIRKLSLRHKLQQRPK